MDKHAFEIQLSKTKNAATTFAGVDFDTKIKTLQSLIRLLQDQQQEILIANQADLSQLAISNPQYDRLLLNTNRMTSIVKTLEQLTHVPDPLGLVLESSIRPNGLKLSKITAPLGVIGIIYESRPNVTIDAFALCFLAGNACVLKGGKEAEHSNRFLVQLIQSALVENQLPINLITLLPPTRESALLLCEASDFIDVLIPRGSQALIDFVKKSSSIPIIETGAGVVHTYFDESADLDLGMQVITNAKTRRVSVCNALDCLIIHQSRLNDLEALVSLLSKKEVELYADSSALEFLQNKYPSHLLFPALDEHFGTEFLSLKLAIKTVENLDEAILHISKYSSGHSEAIIAKDDSSVSEFFKRVDAAAVYANTSTAFTDGAEFGLVAEIGISTQKLHVRGPFSLQHLVTHKWLVTGTGQVRD